MLRLMIAAFTLFSREVKNFCLKSIVSDDKKH